MVGRTFVILILALVLPAVGGDVPVLGMPGDPSPVVVRSVRIEGASVIASDDLKGGMSIRKGRTFLQQMVGVESVFSLILMVVVFMEIKRPINYLKEKP